MFASASKTLLSHPTPLAIPGAAGPHQLSGRHAARQIRSVTASIVRMSLIALLASCATHVLPSPIISSLQRNLVDYYTFDNPIASNAAQEVDQGFGGTN